MKSRTSIPEDDLSQAGRGGHRRSRAFTEDEDEEARDPLPLRPMPDVEVFHEKVDDLAGGGPPLRKQLLYAGIGTGSRVSVAVE
ncbi:hypothetical protein [Sulfodiicoccus acidiphilus]|uniref:hypothetical protein n=1 Tax=Sulfodiicoccus acidiphilus TaxID=1670455 RepID=UPI000F820B4D|nr:hypothetical protein [Sulfodiicoccus acidiphilus]